MAFRLLAYMDGVEYNRKLFQIDGGEEDLPPIKNKADIVPGSEAHSLSVTNGRWILNTEFIWTFVPYPGGYVDPASGAIADVPRNPTNTCYVRVSDAMGVRSWEPLQIGTIQDVNVSQALIGTYMDGNDLYVVGKARVYDMATTYIVFVREDNVVIAVQHFERDGALYRALVPEEAKWYFVTNHEIPKVGDTNPDFQNAVLVAAVDRGNRIPTMTEEEWQNTMNKPDQAFIIDSIFDMKTRMNTTPKH